MSILIHAPKHDSTKNTKILSKHYKKSNFNKIKDLIVKDIIFTDNKISIKFENGYGLIIIPNNNKCSISWFEQCSECVDSDLNLLIGTKILRIECSYDVSDRSKEWYEEVQLKHHKAYDSKSARYKFYRYYIITDNGHIASIYLCNVSNGYYIGWINGFLLTPSISDNSDPSKHQRIFSDMTNYGLNGQGFISKIWRKELDFEPIYHN